MDLTPLRPVINRVRLIWRRVVGYYDEDAYRAYSGKQEHPLDSGFDERFEDLGTPPALMQWEDPGTQPPHPLDTW